MKNIGIIGLGYVGLTLGILASNKGYNIYGIETNEHIKEHLKQNKAHFYEPGIDEIIRKNNNKTFYVVDKFEKEQKLDAIIVTVGTPLHNDQKKTNYEYLLSALKEIEGVFSGNELIILRSTVSVGTTRKVVEPFLQKIATNVENVKVAFCPERTVEGKAVSELQELPQIVSGNSQEAKESAKLFFEKITSQVIVMDQLEEAELIKLFNNTYRDVNFAIGNMFNQIAQSFGLDGVKVINAANKDYARSRIAMPGLVGGPCLEKDVYILTDNAKPSLGKDFVLKARMFNESLEDDIVKWVEKTAVKYGEKRIVLSGIAFKGVPETSDLRGSNSVNIGKKLKEKGFNITLHDFCAIEEELKELNLGNVSTDFYDAIENQNIVVILNNNKKYSEVDCNAMNRSLNQNSVVLDAWDVLAVEGIRKDICICTLGDYLL